MPGGREAARVARPAVAGRLSTVDRVRLVGEIVATYVAVRLRLRRSDLPTVLSALRGGRGRGRGRPIPRDPQRLATAAVRVLRTVPGDARCLTRSLVVVAMLARRGIDTTLVVAARPGDTFAAHAWVERGGRPLLPTEGFDDVRLAEL
jgi:hypothetical protein